MTFNEAKYKELAKKRIALEDKQERPKFNQRMADIVTEFGGSWTFIIMFSLFFITWIVINLSFSKFDHFPFILLNLILSCLAVFQSPFILMSQHRHGEIDRKREERTYESSLKGELEIVALHTKLDGLIKIVKAEKNEKNN